MDELSVLTRHQKTDSAGSFLSIDMAEPTYLSVLVENNFHFNL